MILLVATPGREGSPPRGRGKGCPEGHGPPSKGITPAWAGKSHAVHSPSHGAGDHPRVGGEKWMTPKGEISYIGSPPRGRGKALEGVALSAAHGITPAWAGKSSKARCIPCAGGGSPPRGRGKDGAGSSRGTNPGITPAWAGKRLKRSHRSGIFISGPIPFHSVLHRPAGSGGSRAGRDGSPAGQPQNTGPA